MLPRFKSRRDGGFAAAGVLRCAAKQAVWDGPAKPSTGRLEPWRYPSAQCRSPGDTALPHSQRLHHRANLFAAGQLLEAFQQYAQVAGLSPRSSVPMNGYLFTGRSGWSAFTKANTGEDSVVYLQVSRGAYTINDWFAAYWLGAGTWPVVAHEGWHQFVARRFAGRLPPALEEGLACLFENVRWQGPLPRWNLADNPARRGALAEAKHRNLLLPLPQLLPACRRNGGTAGAERAGLLCRELGLCPLFARSARAAAIALLSSASLADTAAGRMWLPPHTALPYARAWNPDLVGPDDGTLSSALAVGVGSRLPQLC